MSSIDLIQIFMCGKIIQLIWRFKQLESKSMRIYISGTYTEACSIYTCMA